MQSVEASGLGPEGSRNDRSFWSHDDVREALAEAAEMLDRHVKGGQRRLSAKDGPWELVIRDNRAAEQIGGEVADYVEPETYEQVRRQRQLRTAEVDRMEAVLAWVEWLPVGRDWRQLVGVVSLMIGYGGRHVEWAEVKRKLGSDRSPDALRMRFSRAITLICQRLNR